MEDESKCDDGEEAREEGQEEEDQEEEVGGEEEGQEEKDGRDDEEKEGAAAAAAAAAATVNPLQLFDTVEYILKLLVSTAFEENLTSVVPVLQSASQVNKLWKKVVEESLAKLVGRNMFGLQWTSKVLPADGMKLLWEFYERYKNFRSAKNKYSSFRSNNSFCRCISFLDTHVVCGRSDGTLTAFQVTASGSNQMPVNYRPYTNRAKTGRFSWSIVGLFIIPTISMEPEAFYGSVDGYICSVNLVSKALRVHHNESSETEGYLVDFCGSDSGWVGLYAGAPGFSFRVWNSKREIIYAGGQLMDRESVLGRRVSECIDHPIGRIRIQGSLVVVCTKREIISFRLEDPLGIQHGLVGGPDLVVASFDCNNEICVVVDQEDMATVLRTRDFHTMNKFHSVHGHGGSVYAGALNNSFWVMAYVTGGLWTVGLREPTRMRLDQQVTNITAMKADDKWVVASSFDGRLHLWNFAWN